MYTVIETDSGFKSEVQRSDYACLVLRYAHNVPLYTLHIKSEAFNLHGICHGVCSSQGLIIGTPSG